VCGDDDALGCRVRLHQENEVARKFQGADLAGVVVVAVLWPLHRIEMPHSETRSRASNRLTTQASTASCGQPHRQIL